MNSDDWPNRGQRHRVQLEAELIQTDGSKSQTIVSDLSLDGCRIVGWFRIGDPVLLKLPRIGEVRGEVRWALNGSAGVRFIRNAGT